MNARIIQNFLLLSFAFSFVLSSAEIVIPIRRNIEDSNISVSSILTNYSKGSPKTTTTTTTVTDSDKSPSDDYHHHHHHQGNNYVSNRENSNYVINKENNINKRNRMSFTGMRGKKENNNDIILDNYNEPCKGTLVTSSNVIDKRSLKNYKELFGGKRAPLAFHGMRGKKSDEYETKWTKPNPFGLRFLPTNQKLLITSGLFEDGDDILTFEYPEYTNIKKENSESMIGDDDVTVKRSPYSFQGMRGKKGSVDMNLKRTMGFLGMRGKKVPEMLWYTDNKYDKREPQMSFFGMKG